MLVDAEKKLKSSNVLGRGRVITNITEELGFTVVITDICNYVGSSQSERHPVLKKETKKIGINAYTFKNNEKVATIIYLEDFTNALI